MTTKMFSLGMGAAAAGLATLLTMGAALADSPSGAQPANPTGEATLEAMLRPWEMPLRGSVTLSPGFGSYEVDVTAGGSVAIPASIGTGFAAEAPDFRVYLTDTASELHIYLTPGSPETLLVVNDAGGEWRFNASYNPSIDIFNASAGRYDIFVGTLSGGYESATLHIADH